MAQSKPDKALISMMVETMDQDWFQAWKAEVDKRSAIEVALAC